MSTMENKWKNMSLGELVQTLEGLEMEGKEFYVGGTDDEPIIHAVKEEEEED